MKKFSSLELVGNRRKIRTVSWKVIRMMRIVESARRRRRVSRRKEMNVEPIQTQITDLPESVLVHILSFLPTKDAVKTSALANSWKCLWKSVRNLKFHYFLSDKHLFFRGVVDVLSRREPLNIHKFSFFSVVSYLKKPRIETIISYAVNHKVEVLKLRFLYGFGYFLLPCIFTCESLTELKIDMFDEYLEVPSYTYLPSLKTLTLKNIGFKERLLHQLFSGCPILEKLVFEQCTWYGPYTCISVPTLKTLIIEENLETAFEDNCEIVVTGRNLVNFHYLGELTNVYNLFDLSSLVDSSIIVTAENGHWNSREWEVYYRALRLLSGLRHARVLNLSCGFIKALSYGSIYLRQLPVYCNLTSLRLNLGTIDFNCEGLQSLLQKSPSLISLEFIQGVSLNIAGDVKELNLDTVPPCFLTQLKRVLIGHYTSTPEEQQVINVVKKHAHVLEQLCIVPETEPL